MSYMIEWVYFVDIV